MRKGFKGKLVAVSIRFIANEAQRYATIGDWFWRHTTLHIRVSEMKNPKFNMLVAVHEYVEAMLCEEAGISEHEVTRFDMQFEDERSQGMHSQTAEPGDDSRAPYFEQHKKATAVEFFLALILGVNWEEYDATINSL